jgi:hypothetical protein
VSVATGIAPSELLALDAELWDAIDRAESERWDVLVELTASTLELLSALGLAWVKIHSKPGASLGEPVSIPRPEWWRKSEAPSTVAIVPPDRIGIDALSELTGKRITESKRG